MRTKSIPCGYCGCIFEKSIVEIKRSEKNGRGHFCSLSHAVSYGNKVKPRHNVKHLRKGSESDDFSPFRWFMNVIRQRKNRKVFDVNLSDLKEQWEKQNGICPYTGWTMPLPTNSGGYKGCNHNQASVDRIDPDKGYVKGNIQFTCLMANYAKHRFHESKMFEFCEAVANRKHSNSSCFSF